ncbi:MAG: SprT family zinc-dependent metalloprotease [Anaerolineae bacterium]
MRVTVTAPAGSDLAAVEAKVRQPRPLDPAPAARAGTYLPHTPPRRYVSGETHRYLGRQYRLKVEESGHEPEPRQAGAGRAARLGRDPRRHPARPATGRGLVRKAGAARVFYERLLAMLPRFKLFQLGEPQLTIRAMKNRWGSCTDAGAITLNLKLVQAPKPCIDYVIVHELCHLVEYNHGRSFYQLLDRMLPDWQRAAQAAERDGCSLNCMLAV